MSYVPLLTISKSSSFSISNIISPSPPHSKFEQTESYFIFSLKENHEIFSFVDEFQI